MHVVLANFPVVRAYVRMYVYKSNYVYSVASTYIAALQQHHNNLHYNCNFTKYCVVIIITLQYVTFLNHALAGLWPACAWFLEITIMWICTYNYVYVCMCVST